MATESQLTTSPANCCARAIARADLPEPVGPRITTRRGSDWIGGRVLIQRAPQGMVRPKRKNARARMKTTRTRRPKTFARSRERYRAFQSASCWRASESGFDPGCWPGFTASFYAWELFDIALLRVVVEAETQCQVGRVIFRRQRLERVRGGDSAPCGAIQRHVARHSSDPVSYTHLRAHETVL